MTAITRRLASASGQLTGVSGQLAGASGRLAGASRRLAGASRRLPGASGRLAGASEITSSCGISGSGRRGIVVQTGIVQRVCNSEFSTTARSDSSIVVPDEDDIGPKSDIDSPIEASACVSDIRE
jgi:hypothetical protein